MRGIVWKTPLLFAVLLLATARVAGDEIIILKDKDAKGMNLTETGTIKSASPTQVTLTNNKKFEASAIVDVIYLIGSGDLAAECRKLKTAEEKKVGPLELRKMYEDIKPKMAANKAAVTHADYKIGMLSAALAETNKDERKRAIDALSKFSKENPEGWQIVSALHMLAKLHSDDGAFDKAADDYDALKKVPGIPDAVKKDCDASVVNILLQSGQHQKASARIEELLKTLQTTDPQYKRLEMMRYTCMAKDAAQVKTVIQKLREEINKTNDKAQLALAYNTLGDCYLMSGQPEDAKWQYLFVDTLYNQDKTEQQKAIKQLIEVFKQLKQEDKAAEYAEKLDK
jgi:tetratricopeptide (TPR) repeat protein